MKVEPWSRSTTAVWPSRAARYSWLAVFASLLFGVCLLAVTYRNLSPMGRYYLPLYVRLALIPTATANPRVLSMVAPDRKVVIANSAALAAGHTPLAGGKVLAVALSAQAIAGGYTGLSPVTLHRVAVSGLQAWLAAEAYQGEALGVLLFWPGIGTIAVLLVGLWYAIPRDVERRKELKYGRHLRGTRQLTPERFSADVRGDGLGFICNEMPGLLRIPREAENQHAIIFGDTGTGKTTAEKQLLAQFEERGDLAIVYDPTPGGDLVKHFYRPERGDLILNPLDKRSPYWSPAEEVQHEAEATTLSLSLFPLEEFQSGQPFAFFVQAPQKIFAHLLLQRPSPQQLVDWMSNPREIDARVNGTELAQSIDPKSPGQRSGVLASLNMVADSLRLLPARQECSREWTATEWAKQRRGWLFLTSTPSERAPLKPIQSLMIDILVMRLLAQPEPGQRRVGIFLDELASLHRLPQLMMAITEGRHADVPIFLGFQSVAQLQKSYGEHDARTILSQPRTKLFLRVSEPDAARWVSDAIGKVELERLQESRGTGRRGGGTMTPVRQIEHVVMDTQIINLDPMCAYLKFGDRVCPFSFPAIDLPVVAEPLQRRAWRRRQPLTVAPEPAAAKAKPAAEDHGPTQEMLPIGR